MMDMMARYLSDFLSPEKWMKTIPGKAVRQMIKTDKELYPYSENKQKVANYK